MSTLFDKFLVQKFVLQKVFVVKANHVLYITQIKIELTSASARAYAQNQVV